jgi:hypothetical protein
MQEYELVRLLCHFCKRFCLPDSFIPCKTPCCGKLFCHKCLTSRYKYSKAKVSRLPISPLHGELRYDRGVTPNWMCLVCTKKCVCEEVPRKKCIIRKRSAHHTIDSNRNKKVKTVTKFYARADANTRSPLDDRATNENSIPESNYLLPSISSNFCFCCSLFLPS